MKIKQLFLNFISIFFTILLVSFILWNRVLRNRLPRELYPQSNLSFYIILMVLSLLFFLCLFMYYLMKILKILPRTENKIMLFFTKRLEKHKWSKNIIENLL